MGSISEKTASADAQRDRQVVSVPSCAARDHAGFGPLALPAVVAAAHMASRGQQRRTGAGR